MFPLIEFIYEVFAVAITTCQSSIGNYIVVLCLLSSSNEQKIEFTYAPKKSLDKMWNGTISTERKRGEETKKKRRARKSINTKKKKKTRNALLILI